MGKKAPRLKATGWVLPFYIDYKDTIFSFSSFSWSHSMLSGTGKLPQLQDTHHEPLALPAELFHPVLSTNRAGSPRKHKGEIITSPSTAMLINTLQKQRLSGHGAEGGVGKQTGKNQTWARVCCEEGAGEEGQEELWGAGWWGWCLESRAGVSPHQWLSGSSPMSLHPLILPSSLMGWEPGKACSQQYPKPSWSRARSPLWGGGEGWRKIPLNFAGSVPQGGWASALGAPCQLLVQFSEF